MPRTLAIGDVHGCFSALQALLDAVRPGPEDRLICLGDYIDRGPNSAAVLDRLIALQEQTQLIALRGNHEEMLLEARQSSSHRDFWIACGGDTTLASYGRAGRLSDIPASHWHFIEQTCRDWYETDTHIFVHAGLRPHLPPAEQAVTDLHWLRFSRAQRHCSGKIVVCGHTPQPDNLPTNLGDAICLDTAAHDGGFLTCLDLGTGYFWQASERGGVRTDILPAPQ
jgi:serine/threonine protein phosphatase 1